MGIGGGMTRVVKTLILVNIGVFLLQIASGGKLAIYFGLSSILVSDKLFVWQLATYMFLHGGVWHLAFNMFILWMFGREIEGMWGEKPFLRYYLACGIGGGIATFLFTMGSPIITIGASAAIFGILVAYAVLFPDRMITLLIFFVLPVTVKAKHLVMVLAGLELLHCIAGAADGIGHFAHLGGAFVGYIYLKIWKKSSSYGTTDYWDKVVLWFRAFMQSGRQQQSDETDAEVDRILEKITKTGLESLSRREKSILQKRSMKK